MLDCKSANKSQPWAPATLHLGKVGGAAAAAEATTFPRVSQKGNWQQRQPQQKQEQQTNSTNKTAAIPIKTSYRCKASLCSHDHS